MTKQLVAGSIVGTLLTSVAVAATASTSPIQACVNKVNGQVRIVGSPTECKPAESPLSWSQQGPPGPQGPAGPAGPPGPPGSGVRGFEMITQQTTLPGASSGLKTVQIFCSPGKQPVAGGWDQLGTNLITVYRDGPLLSDPSGRKGWSVNLFNEESFETTLVLWVSCVSV